LGNRGFRMRRSVSSWGESGKIKLCLPQKGLAEQSFLYQL